MERGKRKGPISNEKRKTGTFEICRTFGGRMTLKMVQKSHPRWNPILLLILKVSIPFNWNFWEGKVRNKGIDFVKNSKNFDPNNLYLVLRRRSRSLFIAYPSTFSSDRKCFHLLPVIHLKNPIYSVKNNFWREIICSYSSSFKYHSFTFYVEVSHLPQLQRSKTKQNKHFSKHHAFRDTVFILIS